MGKLVGRHRDTAKSVPFSPYGRRMVFAWSRIRAIEQFQCGIRRCGGRWEGRLAICTDILPLCVHNISIRVFFYLLQFSPSFHYLPTGEITPDHYRTVHSFTTSQRKPARQEVLNYGRAGKAETTCGIAGIRVQMSWS